MSTDRDLKEPRLRRRLLGAMNRAPGLAAVSNQLLLKLLEASTLQSFESGATVWTQGQTATCMWILVDGAVLVSEAGAGHSVAHAGVMGADAVLAGRAWPTSGAAYGPLTAVAVPRDVLLDLALRATSMRRSLHMHYKSRGESVPEFVLAAEREAVEWLCVCVPPGWSEGRFVHHLTQVWRAHLPDSIVLVQPDPAHHGEVQVHAGQLPRVVCGARTEKSAVMAAIDVPRVSYVVLDLSRLQGADLRYWRFRVEKAVLWHSGTQEPEVGGLRPECDRVPAVAVPGAVGPLSFKTVRLRLRPADLAGALPDPAKRGMERLARAVTDRTVGIAMGGGGAWGYAHCTLIREILARGVPIDVVSGCSFGALVGAYFASKGLEGLQLLEAAGPHYQRCLPLALLSSTIIGTLAKQDLGDVLLDDLEIPFFPVATDVSNGAAVAIHGTTMAFGVRASGSFPGIFAPTTGVDPYTGQSVRYIDGGIRDNVPEFVLLQAGADMIVSSNIVPPPHPETPSAPLIAAKWWQPIHEFNLLDRATDLWRSMFILFNAAGSIDDLGADVIYDAKPNRFFATSFSASAEIAADATEQAAQVADQALRHWQGVLGQPFDEIA